MFLTGTNGRVYRLIVLTRHKTEKPEGTARGEKIMTKYNGKPARLSFKKLVELITDAHTEAEWNEAYALTEWNAQQDRPTISHKDEEMLLDLLARITPKEIKTDKYVETMQNTIKAANKQGEEYTYGVHFAIGYITAVFCESNSEITVKVLEEINKENTAEE